MSNNNSNKSKLLIDMNGGGDKEFPPPGLVPLSTTTPTLATTDARPASLMPNGKTCEEKAKEFVTNRIALDWDELSEDAKERAKRIMTNDVCYTGSPSKKQNGGPNEGRTTFGAEWDLL
jgi:hypothetical protein